MPMPCQARAALPNTWTAYHRLLQSSGAHITAATAAARQHTGMLRKKPTNLPCTLTVIATLQLHTNAKHSSAMP
jgi:hypothetical protein